MAKLIMVINDTQEILELFDIILTDAGYQVILYSQAMRDLDEIKKIKPDLIVVDQLFGNEAPGWQLIQKLKMDGTTALIPLVVCSAELNRLKELEGHLKAKNIQVVVKPFDISELLNAVELAFREAAKGE
jgi:DNA-binding response OmpR family regulator